MKAREGGPGFDSPIARFATLILVAVMVVAAGFAIYVGRGTTFTPDEWYWLVATPGMHFETLFQTSTGHLQLVPRAVYKVLLELVGTQYVWFRLFSVASLILTVGLLYRWLIQRVGAMVALVPCILLLFFGSDAVHLIRGNGFTILFSLACGLAGLLMIERNERRRDLAACLLLSLGLATYTVALPFVVGTGVSLLILRHWRRLWIPAIPLALYGIWKLWLKTTGPQSWGGEIHLSNVWQIPEWIFDALSSVLSAMTGFGYGFTDVSDSGPDEVIGPVLATLFLIGVAWRLSQGGIGRGIWVALSVGVALWSIQCLASDPDFPGLRTADETRYLYPGAVAVIMIGAELVAGKKWNLPAYLVLLVIGGFGLASNIQQAITFGDNYRADTDRYRLMISGQSIALDDDSGRAVIPGPEPVVTPSFPGLIAAMAHRPYGGIGYTTDEILSLPAEDRAALDQVVVEASGLALQRPDGVVARECSPVPSVADSARGAELPAGTVLFRGNEGTSILVGRYGDEPSVPLSTQGATPSLLTTPPPLDGVPWRFVAKRGGLQICRAEGG